MRNPDRIRVVITAISEAWREHPDLTLAELLRSLGLTRLRDAIPMSDRQILDTLGLKGVREFADS